MMASSISVTPKHTTPPQLRSKQIVSGKKKKKEIVMTGHIPPHLTASTSTAPKKRKSSSSHDSDHDQNKNKKKKKKTVITSCFCGICFDYKKHSEMFRGSKNCKHGPFCSDCISNHVAAQIQQNALKVNCPNPSCGIELKPKHLNPILLEQVVDRWESARCESLIAVWSKTYCPFKDCSVLLVDDGGEVVTSAECPSCHRLFCAQCKVPWHGEMSCKEFQKSELKDEKDSERKFLDLAKRKKWQRCPKCSFYVQRRSGCEHMACRCGCNFCYKCGKHWKHGHLCHKSKST